MKEKVREVIYFLNLLFSRTKKKKKKKNTVKW